MKKKRFLSLVALFILIPCLASMVKAQSTDEMLNLMISKGLIKQDEADSLRAEAAIKAQAAKEKQKSFNLWASRYLQLSGYVQARFQSFQSPGVIDGMDIRRARLDLRGDLLPAWEYRIQLDFASSPKILDAYAVFKPFNYLKFQVGQFKVPLSADNIMASSKMDFIDRSQVVEALVSRGKDVLGNNNGRDIGVMVFGSLFKTHDRYLVDYYVGGFNGQGINVADKNEAKDAGGRLILHPVAGLDIGGAYFNGYDFVIIKPDTGNFIRARYAGEFSYTRKRLTVRSEYIAGQDGKIKKEGFFASAAYFVLPKKLQVLVKYDQFEPNLHAGNDITFWYVGGINFFFNEYAKIGVNYSYRTSEKNAKDFKTKKDLISAQLQIGF